ncbi:MAG: M48 family metalloprotease [Spirochaetota bacterium]
MRKHTTKLLFSLLIFLLSCATADGGRKEKVDEAVLEEIRIGRSLAARLTAKYGLMKDAATTRYLNMLGASISSLSSRPEIKFRFGILDSDSVNGFACPGGYILITAGAIKSMENEAELAFVLAHEISHVVLNHSNIKPKKKAGVIEFIATFLGGGGAVLNMAIEQASSELEKVLLESGREKDLELEADRSGVIYASVGMGYDYNASIQYLERIYKSSKDKEYSTRKKTHPPLTQRIQKLRQLASSQNFPATQKYNPERFQSFVTSMPAIGQSAAAQASGNEELIKEVGLGRAVGSELVKKYKVLKSIPATKYLNLLAKSFVSIREIRPDVDYYVGILDTDEILSFAAPGGYVFVSKGALKNVKNESELAFVIGREMVHIALKHPLELRPTGFLSRMLDSDKVLAMSTSAAVDKTMTILTKVGRKPDKEFATDRAALFYLSLGMGYSYTSAINYLERVRKSDKNTVFTDTLPPVSKRIQVLHDFSKKQSLPVAGKTNAQRFNKYMVSFDAPTNLDKTKVRTPDKKLIRELQIGRALAANLIQKYGIIQHENATNYMNLLGKSMTALLEERPEIDYYFGVLNSQEVLTFACPGGYILVSEGALKAVKNEAELAFLIAREMSHVLLRHSLGEEKSSNRILALFSSSLLDGSGEVRPAVKELTDILTSSGRSKEEELEADVSAILYASLRSGYDYGSAIAFLNRLKKNEARTSLIRSTYPSFEERIQTIRDFAKQQSIISSAKTKQGRFQKYIGTL